MVKMNWGQFGANYYYSEGQTIHSNGPALISFFGWFWVTDRVFFVLHFSSWEFSSSFFGGGESVVIVGFVLCRISLHCDAARTTKKKKNKYYENFSVSTTPTYDAYAMTNVRFSF